MPPLVHASRLHVGKSGSGGKEGGGGLAGGKNGGMKGGVKGGEKGGDGGCDGGGVGHCRKKVEFDFLGKAIKIHTLS